MLSYRKVKPERRFFMESRYLNEKISVSVKALMCAQGLMLIGALIFVVVFAYCYGSKIARLEKSVQYLEQRISSENGAASFSVYKK